MIRYCLSLLISVACTTANAQDTVSINSEFSFPGGFVELTIDKQSDELPIARFGIHEPIVIQEKSSWRIIVGLSLETLPGDYVVYVKRATKGSPAFNLKFTVAQKKYPLAEQLISPQQTQEVKGVLSSLSDIDFSNSVEPSLPLRLPFNGDWLDEFGTIHQVQDGTFVAQNQLRHQAAPLSTVQAPQNAIVSLIKTSSDGTSTMVLDHGRGLYSIISGFGDLTVETGNGVVAGAVLGRVQATGVNDANSQARQTSMLGWQLVINSNYVNPLLLVAPDEQP